MKFAFAGYLDKEYLKDYGYVLPEKLSKYIGRWCLIYTKDNNLYLENIIVFDYFFKEKMSEEEIKINHPEVVV